MHTHDRRPGRIAVAAMRINGGEVCHNKMRNIINANRLTNLSFSPCAAAAADGLHRA